MARAGLELWVDTFWIRYCVTSAARPLTLLLPYLDHQNRKLWFFILIRTCCDNLTAVTSAGTGPLFCSGTDTRRAGRCYTVSDARKRTARLSRIAALTALCCGCVAAVSSYFAVCGSVKLHRPAVGSAVCLRCSTWHIREHPESVCSGAGDGTRHRWH